MYYCDKNLKIYTKILHIIVYSKTVISYKCIPALNMVLNYKTIY